MSGVPSEVDTSSGRPPVSAIVLNFNADLDMLKQCIAAISADAACTEIVLVDNGSIDRGAAASRAAEESQRARVLLLPTNGGFSAGINAGVAISTGELLWIVNNDATPAPNALGLCVDHLVANPTIDGVAPLLVFADQPRVIDAFGNAIDSDGAAFNVGIGQIDVGQFRDRPIFGPCFAAALIRRSTWNRVGPLDARYFLYYEDVEWNWRAGLMGARFAGVAAAKVRHVHSASSRHLAHDFKYRLIQRNLLVTLVKVGERPWATVLRRCLALSANVVRRHYPTASLRALLGFIRLVPHALRERRKIQRARVRADVDLVAFSAGERPFINPVDYTPDVSWEALRAMYSPLATTDERAAEIADLVDSVASTPRNTATDARLVALVEPDGPELTAYVARLLRDDRASDS